MNELTLEVKSQWAKLSPELQDALKVFAYHEPETRPKSLADRLRGFRSSVALGRVLRKQPELVREYLNAANNLTEAILDAIERENPEHQETVAQAIEEAFSDTNNRTMNAEEAREWNREIFDQAFE